MQPRSIDDSPGPLPGESTRLEARTTAERTADLCQRLDIPDDWLCGEPNWSGRLPSMAVAWERIPELLDDYPDSHGEITLRPGGTQFDILVHLVGEPAGKRLDLATVLSSSPLDWRGRIDFEGVLSFGGAR